MNAQAKDGLLVCWHSQRAGEEVLTGALRLLAQRRVPIGRVLYLRQEDQPPPRASVPVDTLVLPLADPTNHAAIYRLLQERLLPQLRHETRVNINVSPGTPAMHAVWLILHAGGAFPVDTTLWSTQSYFHEGQQRHRLQPVEFPLTTYLAEIRELGRRQPSIAYFDPDTSQSPSRRAALAAVLRMSRVPDIPLLLLGERGTGKSRLVETLVALGKGRADKVVAVACGALTEGLAESLLFGHRKGAFTGATAERHGLLAEAAGGVLFLDEVQDLPKAMQRKLLRVLQDNRHRFRPVGADQEAESDFELVCASNQPASVIRGLLDPDFYDRVSLLTAEVPPLRQCREDIKLDWAAVWKEMQVSAAVPAEAPWSPDLEAALTCSDLPGNLRDLQHLAALILAWQGAHDKKGLAKACEEWRKSLAVIAPGAENQGAGSATREERIHAFRGELARQAKRQHGTWRAAAVTLSCDEKTLRDDAQLGLSSGSQR